MKLLAVGLLCLAAAGAVADGDNYRIKSPQALGCGAVEYFPIHPVDHVPDGCQLFHQGDTFRWDTSISTAVSGWTHPNDFNLWFKKADVEPIDPAHDPATAPQCKDGELGGGGEVDRLEADAKGRLYRKRYLLTTKCVKGQWRQYAKKLN